MEIQDLETLSIAAAVSNVLEGKVKEEEASYPHKMYDPETGKAVTVKDEAEHEKYNKMDYVHDKPNLESDDEPEKDDEEVTTSEAVVGTGEKEFKAKHKVKKSGKLGNDETITKETKDDEEDEEEVDEAFFQKALKKFGAKSPSELDKEKRKEFFNYVDKNYQADSEED